MLPAGVRRTADDQLTVYGFNNSRDAEGHLTAVAYCDHGSVPAAVEAVRVRAAKGSASVVVSCPPGTVLVGGGFDGHPVAAPPRPHRRRSSAISSTQWQRYDRATLTAEQSTLTAIAYCAPGVAPKLYSTTVKVAGHTAGTARANCPAHTSLVFGGLVAEKTGAPVSGRAHRAGGGVQLDRAIAHAMGRDRVQRRQPNRQPDRARLLPLTVSSASYDPSSMHGRMDAGCDRSRADAAGIARSRDHAAGRQSRGRRVPLVVAHRRVRPPRGIRRVGLPHLRAMAQLALRDRPAGRAASACASRERSRSCRSITAGVRERAGSATPRCGRITACRNSGERGGARRARPRTRPRRRSNGAVRAYRGAMISRGGDRRRERAGHMARYLRYDWADDGSLEGQFRIPPEMAAIFVKGIDCRARQRVPPDPDDEIRPAGRTREVATTNCDGLILMAEALLCAIAVTGSAAAIASRSSINADAEVLDRRRRRHLRARRWARAGAGDRRGGSRATHPIVNLLLDEGRPVARSARRRRASPRRPAAPCTPATGAVGSPGCGARVRSRNIHHIRHRAQQRRQRADQPRRAVLVPPPARARGRLERALRRPPARCWRSGRTATCSPDPRTTRGSRRPRDRTRATAQHGVDDRSDHVHPALVRRPARPRRDRVRL